MLSLIIYGVGQGAYQAKLLGKEEDPSSEENMRIAKEGEEALEMIGFDSFKAQKGFLKRSMLVIGALSLIFSIPAFFVLFNGTLSVAMLAAGLLLILDCSKIFFRNRFIDKAKDYETLLDDSKSHTVNKIASIVRLILKAIVIAFLLSKGV